MGSPAAKYYGLPREDQKMFTIRWWWRRLVAKVLGSLVHFGFPMTAYWRWLGANIGRNVHITAESKVDAGFAMFLTLADNVVVAMGTRFVLHDSSFCNVKGLPIRVGRILVKEGAYLGANVTILPGVCIGQRSIVGAGALVTEDIPDGTVAVGTPARVIGTVDELAERFLAKGQEAGDRFFFEDYVPKSQQHRYSNKELTRRHATFVAETLAHLKKSPSIKE